MLQRGKTTRCERAAEQVDAADEVREGKAARPSQLIHVFGGPGELLVERAEDRLDRIASVVPAVAERARRLLWAGVRWLEDGTLLLGHAPEIAPQAYRVRVFPPAPEPWFRDFASRLRTTIPAEYGRVLEVVNGCSCLGLELYGLAGTSLLDRTSQKPMQLALAVSDWAREYGRPESFHFGSSGWSDEDNCAYFWGPDGPFAALRSGAVVGNWRTLDNLLDDELSRLEPRRQEA